jgi:hypothetical protein
MASNASACRDAMTIVCWVQCRAAEIARATSRNSIKAEKRRTTEE